MQGPRGETLLYDAGSLGPPEYATQTVASYLWERGLMRIDGIVISHADIDHYNAVPGLLERFRIGAVYVSPVMFQSFGAPIRRVGLNSSAMQSTAPAFQFARSGPAIGCRLDRMSPCTCSIHPSAASSAVTTPTASTLAVEYVGRQILLPWRPRIARPRGPRSPSVPYDCDILLAPHHGSRRSDPPGFAAWSRRSGWSISGGGGDDIEPVCKHTAGARRRLSSPRTTSARFNSRFRPTAR